MSQVFLLKTERGWVLFILLSRFGLNFVAFISSLNSVMVDVVLVHDTLFWSQLTFGLGLLLRVL